MATKSRIVRAPTSAPRDAPCHAAPVCGRVFSRDGWIVGAVACLVFLNTLGNEFAYDDLDVVRDNPRITRLWDVRAIWGSDWWDPGPGRHVDRHRDILYRPLVVQTFALNYAVSGLSAWSYHAVNVGLHALTCMVLAALTARLFGDARVALWTGLLFAVLPIHVEAVAGVVGRANVMAALFCVLAMLALTRERAALGAGWRGRAVAWRVASLACVPLALFCKEDAICLPVLLLLTEWFLRRKAHGGVGSCGGAVGEVSWRRRAAGYYLWMLPGVGAYLALRYVAAGGKLVRDVPSAVLDNPLIDAVFIERVFSPFKLLAQYIVLTVRPTQLSSDYSFNALPLAGAPTDWLTLLGLLVVAAAAWAAVRSARGEGVVLYIVLFFAATYALASNTVLLIGTLLAERLFYLPSAAVCWAMALGVRELVRRARRAADGAERRAALLRWLGVAVCVVFGVRTVVRNLDWHDSDRLFLADVRTRPESARLQLFAARSLIRAGEWDAAERHIRRALAIHPDYVDAIGNLAQVFARQGRTEEARRYYQLALQMLWDNPELKREFGRFRAEVEGGAGGASAEELEAALADRPGDRELLRRLAEARSGSGEYERSIFALRQLVKLDPTDREARLALANVLMIDEQFAAAREQYEVLIAQDETDWRAHTHLAAAVAREDAELAVRHARRAVELAPDLLEPRLNLGQALVEAGRTGEAVAVLREVLVRLPAGEPARAVVERRIETLERRL